VGKVKQWFYKDKEAINTWSKCSATFLAKFFPVGKPMFYGEESPISSKHKWNPYRRRGKGFKSTSKPVPTMGWKVGWCSRTSTMG
jgi:hypothetical protein